MALDINALKRKLNELNKQGKGANDTLWRPQKGSTTIRIVPWKEKPEWPFIELSFYYDFGKKTILSPATFGRPDPIQEFGQAIIDELFKNNPNPTKEEMRETYSRAKPYRPQLRTFVPVIVRGEEEKGVRYWSFGSTVFTDIATIMKDEDYGDITDPMNGTDIVVEYIPKEESDTNFAKTKIYAKRNSSPLAGTEEKRNQFLRDQPDILEVFTEPSYEELLTVLSNHLQIDSADDAIATPTPAPAKTAPSSNKTPLTSPSAIKSNEVKSKVVADFIDEFEEAFN